MTILISKVNQLGDNVVFFPAVQYLRRMLPDAELVLVTSPGVRELYESCVVGVRVLTTPTVEFNSAWKHPWQLLSLMRAWRAFRPDMVLLGDDQGNVAHLLASCSGAGKVFGPLNRRLPTNRLNGCRVPLDLSTLVAHQNWELLRALAEELAFSISDKPPAPDLSALIMPDTRAHDVIIHPGASRAYKCWPIERFAELASELAGNHRVGWIVSGTDTETFDLDPRIHRLRTRDLKELVSTIAAARLFVGNNSGPMNIASALGVAGVIFNGPSTPNWNPAWHQERFSLLTDAGLTCQPCDRLTHPVNVCLNVSEPMACMKRWTVEKVVELCAAKLANL